MSRFGSIESRHGVNDPAYVPPAPEPDIEIADDDGGHTLGILEAFVAVIIPIAGLGLAVWRFGRGDVGPGIANLMLGAIGFVAMIALLHP